MNNAVSTPCLHAPMRVRRRRRVIDYSTPYREGLVVAIASVAISLLVPVVGLVVGLMR